MSVKEISCGSKTIQIKKFNITDMVDYCTIAIIAKRGSGKSFLTRDILYRKRHIPAFVVISRTEKLNSFYSEFIPDLYIYSEYDSDILSNIYTRQLMMREHNSKRVQNNKKAKDDNVMLIMDDCMSSKGEWAKDKNITELFFNGRHHHISFILIMQYSVGIKPEMRSNFDYIFLLAEDIISNRKRLYEHYAGMFPTFDIFQQVFSDITEDYGIMVINNRSHSKDISDKVFWYKAKEIPPFKIGNKKFRDYHKKNYNKEWVTINKSTNLDLLASKRSVKINVDKIK